MHFKNKNVRVSTLLFFFFDVISIFSWFFFFGYWYFNFFYWALIVLYWFPIATFPFSRVYRIWGEDQGLLVESRLAWHYST